MGINDRGEVVGNANTASGFNGAWLWIARRGKQALANIGGGLPSWALGIYEVHGINNHGQIVGDVYTTSSSTCCDAFLWTRNRGMRDLGRLGLITLSNAVNDRGEVVGEYDPTDQSLSAFLWTRQSGMQDLGLGDYSYALGINDQGEVVGSFNGAAFLWTPPGGMQQLGTLGGGFAVATAISNCGEVVGTSATADGTYHAFLWTSRRGMRDLGTLGGDNSGASAINDRGQVAGAAQTANGQIHAVVWSVH